MFKLKRRIFPRRKSGVNEGGGSDGENLSDFDSSAMDEASDDDGPTIITVDDGLGGIKHIRVSHPPESQYDTGEPIDSPVDEEEDSGMSHIGKSNKLETMAQPTIYKASEDMPIPKAKGLATSSADTELSASKNSLGHLLKREFGSRNPFHIETTGEKLRKRIVSKKGVVNISKGHLDHGQRRRFFRDFFNTMLDMRWRYVLTIFCLSFFLSWLGFAIIWYLIFYLHGDFEPDHLPDQQAKSGWVPCASAIVNFASCFLFSLETQQTIGYGSRQTTEECPDAILIMSFQSVVGVIIQACMVGTIFAKLTRPKKRAETLMFSKNAIICQRDGYLCLCFRLANMRSSHLVECHTKAILVSKKVTEEGEVIPYHQTELNVGTDLEGEEDTIFFIWPTTITHRIDEDSPFYHMSARDFLKKRYEIIVVLEGIVEPTGMSIQARSSYLPNEILWGYAFMNVVNYKWRDEQYKIDYTAFNKVCKVDTPTCSAKVLAEQVKASKERSLILAQPKRSVASNLDYGLQHSSSDASTIQALLSSKYPHLNNKSVQQNRGSSSDSEENTTISNPSIAHHQPAQMHIRFA
ncbi:hypothetical protein TCAL_00777 [Tigriopus californicus]|uniref:Inward rectifier potassium channel C-terminal domain-containing protein n=1 Tax=Tigriopus californicus TaxID=6832 RepID=A0A553NEF7_TIGCA|nr:ATP-sensitive inward rectifier potassium channel 1-like [Tigriopus californicus]TRY63827.1 hypothetical protein TCAL_00777 [Tigriopus californicus]|eukprot:TCALIF_00777-PA protein Name:"Similar to KCNJ12 ATP-sensitive inward rectifier potassium channel 12 (Homo sapiens)" AED:0.09 eAED:0.09 QI:0/-1/0/1/-1/1/1/0/577